MAMNFHDFWYYGSNDISMVIGTIITLIILAVAIFLIHIYGFPIKEEKK